jgi:hypothetical protein
LLDTLLIEAPVNRHFAQLHRDPQALTEAVTLYLETACGAAMESSPSQRPNTSISSLRDSASTTSMLALPQERPARAA